MDPAALAGRSDAVFHGVLGERLEQESRGMELAEIRLDGDLVLEPVTEAHLLELEVVSGDLQLKKDPIGDSMVKSPIVRVRVNFANFYGNQCRAL